MLKYSSLFAPLAITFNQTPLQKRAIFTDHHKNTAHSNKTLCCSSLPLTQQSPKLSFGDYFLIIKLHLLGKMWKYQEKGGQESKWIEGETATERQNIFTSSLVKLQLNDWMFLSMKFGERYKRCLRIMLHGCWTRLFSGHISKHFRAHLSFRYINV